MSTENRPTMEPELRTMLGRHREELLRRALALAVTRSSLEELAERPLGDRLDELELLFEAAAPELLCRAAWRVLGERGPMAGAGVATYPEDGSSGTEIVAAAYDALWRNADIGGEAGDDAGAGDDRPPAPVHPLRPL